MFITLRELLDKIRNRDNPFDNNIEAYASLLDMINNIRLASFSDLRLKELSSTLKVQARGGAKLDVLLVEAFALVCEVSYRVLSLRPFDVQVMAGIALHQGKVVEMQTGEGKTLSAVMPAYLHALTGRGVHVLTFNDYLAGRDARWMGPVFEFLGMTTGIIGEEMSIPSRQHAYASDITYLTAKESGFDYLRDFLCMEKGRLVHRPLHYAIVDEADSILIDEARVPLVIAGDASGDDEAVFSLPRLVTRLKPGVDYEVEDHGKNVYLTDSGLVKAESMLGLFNLYDPRNLDLLTRLNCALHAEVLLARDRDYLVRNGKIELLDEFTGRVAARRHWPDTLQAAVAAKEGLPSASRSTIMCSITLQHFLRLYPGLCGMTGTAHTAAAELNDLYGLDVVVIPPNRPCIRHDHPDMIFSHKEAKQKALVAEVKRAHEAGQPVLIGTSSVKESQMLAADLRRSGIGCRVLNAKHDDKEAAVIARAGEPGAVTVSTNMAGRGVDIKLGGKAEQHRDRVVAAGGLYVIGTNRHESRRIDNQLRGRAGRQGDPGVSRFFISLEDDLFTRYEIAGLIPIKHYPHRQDAPIDDPVVLREVARAQRLAEGYNADTRKQLWRYSFILEQQRRIIHAKRQDVLMDLVPLQLLSSKAPERYSALCRTLGEQALRKAEKQLTLYYVNKCWAEYLDYIAYVREGIHLVVIGKNNPLDEFHQLAIAAFDQMLERIDAEIIRTFNIAEIRVDGIDMDKQGLKGPSSTWTYLINESPDQFSNLPHLIRATAAYAKGTLFTVQSLCKRLFSRNT